MKDQKTVQKRPLTPTEAAQKWEPLVQGIEEPRTLLLTAWAMEQEAKFLNSVIGTDKWMGPQLKFIFPAMRKAIPLLTESSVTFERVFETLWVVAEEMFDPESYGCVKHDRLSTDEMRGFVAPLAERVHDYIVKFPG